MEAVSRFLEELCFPTAIRSQQLVIATVILDSVTDVGTRQLQKEGRHPNGGGLAPATVQDIRLLIDVIVVLVVAHIRRGDGVDIGLHRVRAAADRQIGLVCAVGIQLRRGQRAGEVA